MIKWQLPRLLISPTHQSRTPALVHFAENLNSENKQPQFHGSVSTGTHTQRLKTTGRNISTFRFFFGRPTHSPPLLQQRVPRKAHHHYRPHRTYLSRRGRHLRKRPHGAWQTSRRRGDIQNRAIAGVPHTDETTRCLVLFFITTPDVLLVRVWMEV